MRNGETRGDFDAIVIGSGMGGLTTAALLARCAGRRVLVLERHWRAGGFTHTFSRPGGFHWDVGLHYVGADVVRPGMPRDVFRVATGGAVEWNRMPDPFERLVFPGFEVELRSGEERFVEDLSRAFPGEARAIRAFLRDARRATSWMAAAGVRALAPAPVARAVEWALSPVNRIAGARTKDVLDGRFRDPRLKAVLGARWADHGLPPGESAFLAHAVIVRHYLEGGYYPAGSAATIAEGATRVVEEAGGAVRVRAPVERILVRGGRAAGVRLASGEEISAPLVVSDAGARNTYLKLVPEDVPVPFRERLRALPTGMSTATLYLGLSASPERLGVRGENFWIHDDLDQDAMWTRRHAVPDGDVSHVYVSFPSMKDPRARAHTAEVITAVDARDFSRWDGTRWKKRGAEYEGTKERIADAMLAVAARRLPGLRELVVHRELSTPLSTREFTDHPGGEIYGIPWTPERARMRWLGHRTPVPGLLLTGADALFPGIVGAMMSGAFAAAAAEGARIFRAIRSAARSAGGAPRATSSATSPSSV
jgi:all-trans-retinol 13,14-reductase